MAGRLGQPVIVKKTGAGTNVAQAAVNSAPDGRTLLLVGTASAINATLYGACPSPSCATSHRSPARPLSLVMK